MKKVKVAYEMISIEDLYVNPENDRYINDSEDEISAIWDLGIFLPLSQTIYKSVLRQYSINFLSMVISFIMILSLEYTSFIRLGT